MADRGTKRRCLECGTAFYDMGRTPIVCPKCGTVHEPQTLLKSDGRLPRKSRPPAPPPPTVDTEPAPEAEEESPDEAEDEDDVVPEEDEEENAPPEEPDADEAERER